MNNLILNNNIEIPDVAFGTWNLTSDIKEIVNDAINIGYRSIDTAYSYGNDFQVGKAIKSCGLSRKELFITNKVWNTFRGKEATVNACKKSLKLMKLDYFDLYLIHWPEPVTNPDWKQINLSTWQGMEELYESGIVRAIGVSNFCPHHIEALIDSGISVKPMVNQIEFHPGMFPKETYDYCERNKIVVQGWSPTGSGAVLTHPTILQLSQKYSCSPAQICLKWLQSKNVIPVSRSKSKIHMEENFFLPDFNFIDQDIKLLDEMTNVGCSPYVPDVNHPF